MSLTALRNTLRLEIARDPAYLDLYDEQADLEFVYEQYNTAVSQTQSLRADIATISLTQKIPYCLSLAGLVREAPSNPVTR